MRAELEFDSFYAATRPRLLHQLTIVTLDREQAADALQEAYVRAWQRWERLVEYDDPESWVADRSRPRRPRGDPMDPRPDRLGRLDRAGIP